MVMQHAGVSRSKLQQDTRTPASDAPISRLLTELLAGILWMCVSEREQLNLDLFVQEGVPLVDQRSPTCMPFSHVCRRWRLITFQTPMLWTHIPAGVSVPWFAECLRRSQSVAVSVEISVPRWAKDVTRFELLIRNMHRVHSLLLSANHSVSNSSTVAFMGVVETLIGLVEEMETPGLHTLVVNVSKGLRSSLIGLPLKMDRVPSVRRLALSEGIYTPFVSTPLALRHLRLGGFCLDGVHMRWLLKAAPHLRSLDIGGGFMELYETTNVRTSVMSELTRLRLQSMYYVWDLVTLLCWMPHVKALHVEQGIAGRSNPRSPHGGDNAWHAIPEFHDLREAHLAWTSSVPHLLHLLQRTPNLETLTLQLPLGASSIRTNTASDVPAVSLDKLTHLRVSGPAWDVELLLGAILLPKATQMDVRIRDDAHLFAECMRFTNALSGRFHDMAAEEQNEDTEDSFYHIRLVCAHKTAQVSVAREDASPPRDTSFDSADAFDSSSFVLWFLRVRSFTKDESTLRREALVIAEPRPLFPTPDDFTALADAAWSRPWHNFLSEPDALHIATPVQNSQRGTAHDVWPAADPGMVADVWQPLLAQLSQVTHLALSGAAVRGVLETLIVGEPEAPRREALEGRSPSVLPLLAKLTVCGARDIRSDVEKLVKQLCYTRVQQGSGLRCFEFVGVQ